MNKQVKIIAFYLPQYHPFKENDEWWGKGFTEWTNVGKAKPLFRGHNQPRVPTELGYYDLRLPLVREQQAQMAQDAGIYAFCYWHYWFGNGKRLIPEVFQEVLDSGKPDFPFCLGWANHSWYAKNWNSDGTTTNRLLMEQTYPGIDDEKLHFTFLIKAFKDKRYVKVEDKPLLYIFDPVSIPEQYLLNFRSWTKENGFPDIYLVANISSISVARESLYRKGFDAVTYQRLGTAKPNWLQQQGAFGQHIDSIYKRLKGFIQHRPPFMNDYKDVYHSLVQPCDEDVRVIPTILPQWDHTPRSGWNGHLLVNANPDIFRKHVRDVLAVTKDKPKDYKLVFLKSWNEWGEGNMMEPDITYGRGFINALREELDDFESTLK
jgi:lipopolysaccharide biosynthesis protein